MLTRIYGTAFFRQADLDAHLAQLEEARRRDHRRIGRDLDLFHFDPHVAGRAVLAPARHGDLERARATLWRRSERRPRLRRGADADHLRVELWKHSGHWDKYRDNMFFTENGRAHAYGLKPMNCPGHVLVFRPPAAQLPRPADAATRSQGPVHRDEPLGTLHGLCACIHITQDDAHIFCTRSRSRTRSSRASTAPDMIYAHLRPDAAARALAPARRTGSATTRSGTWPRRRSRGARASRHRVRAERGGRRVLRAQDRPAHDRRDRPLVADGHDPARLPDAGAVRPVVRRGRQRRPHARR